jgi:hypothetical protein
MKRTLVLISWLILLLASCGPVKTYVNVEAQGESEHIIPIEGRRVGVITVSDSEDRDSALVSELGMGIAQKIESEMGTESGSIGVYSVSAVNGGIREPGSLDLLAVQTNTDMIIAFDSLYVGSYTIARGENAYYEGNIRSLVSVMLPISFNVMAYDVEKLATEYSREISDTITWTIMAEEVIQNSAAIAQANAHLKEAFKGVGEKVASIFLPSWNQEERMIVCYGGSKWENAYYLAHDFKWEQAMDVWLELVKGGAPEKQGAAAYNLAVACEILGKYDTALKWLDFAESKCYFAQMTTLRKKLQER